MSNHEEFAKDIPCAPPSRSPTRFMLPPRDTHGIGSEPRNLSMVAIGPPGLSSSNSEDRLFQTAQRLPLPATLDGTNLQFSGYGAIPSLQGLSKSGVSRSPSLPQGGNYEPLLERFLGDTHAPWFPGNLSTVTPRERPQLTPLSGVGALKPRGDGHQSQTQYGRVSFQGPQSDSGYGTRNSVSNYSTNITEMDQDCNSQIGYRAETQISQPFSALSPSSSFPHPFISNTSMPYKSHHWKDCQSVGDMARGSYGGLDQFSINSHGTNFDLASDNILSTMMNAICQRPSSQVYIGSEPYRNFFCSYCFQLIEQKAQLKKHYYKHVKPYKCEVPGCSRKEGFSSSNDRERHMMCLHPSMVRQGSHIVTYHCPIEGCKEHVRQRTYRRLDNFKAHLKNKHKELATGDAVEAVILRAKSWAQPYGLPVSAGQGLQGFCLPPSHLTERADDEGVSMFEEQPENWNAHFPDTAGAGQALQASKEEILGDLRINHMGTIHHGHISAIETFPDHRHLEASALSQDNFPQEISLFETETFADPMETPCDQSDESAGSSPPKQVAEQIKAAEIPRSIPQGSPTRHTEADDESPQHEKDVSSKPRPDGDLTIKVGKLQPGQDLIKASSPAGVVESKSGNIAVAPQELSQVVSLEPSPLDLRSLKSSLAKQNTEDLQQVLKDLGYVVHLDKRRSGAGRRKFRENAGQKQGEKEQSCPKCDVVGRPCDLKKHMRRHDRPFGCTYAGCWKIFGSKDEWQRHENAKHFHQESWRCREGPEGNKCEKVCYRKQIFQDHLKMKHSFLEQSSINERLRSCHSGLQLDPHFWCGFCERVITPETLNAGLPVFKSKGLALWTIRFNHIADHFTGKNEDKARNIEDWIMEDTKMRKPAKSNTMDTTSSSTRSSSLNDNDNLNEQDGAERQMNSSSSRYLGSHEIPIELTNEPLEDLNEIASPRPDTSPSRILPPSDPKGKKRAIESCVDEKPPEPKRTRIKEKKWVTYCCQCGMYNSEVHKECLACPQPHLFCDDCYREQVELAID